MKLYHWTPSENVDNILKTGLRPGREFPPGSSQRLKSSWNETILADVVYLTASPELCEAQLSGSALLEVEVDEDSLLPDPDYFLLITKTHDVVSLEHIKTNRDLWRKSICGQSALYPGGVCVEGPIPPERIRFVRHM